MSYDDLVRNQLVPEELMASNEPLENQKIQMLRNRIVPGSGATIEQLIIANHAVIVLASTEKKGLLKVTKKAVKVGGSDLNPVLNGLNDRMNTVRHMLGGDSPVFGVLVLSSMPSAQITMLDTVAIGSPRAIFDFVTDNHEAAESRDILAIGNELKGIFLDSNSFSKAA